MYPYPIKDWRDGSLYEDYSDMDDDTWAWEFVRRNGKYQEAFDKYSPSIEDTPWLDLYSWEDCPEDYPNVDLAPIFETAEKYGLASGRLCNFPNPRHMPKCIFWARLEPLEFSTWQSVEDGDQPVMPENEYDLVVKLDMRMPLSEQQENIGHLFDTYSKEGGFGAPKIRKQFRLYPSYVRVLDAFADGADKKEVASVLLPDIDNNYSDSFAGDKRISNWKKEAERLRDGGFAALLGIPK